MRLIISKLVLAWVCQHGIDSLVFEPKEGVLTKNVKCYVLDYDVFSYNRCLSTPV